MLIQSVSVRDTLSQKCPNTEFFLVRIFPYSDQKKLRIWTLFTQWYFLTNSANETTKYSFKNNIFENHLPIYWTCVIFYNIHEFDEILFSLRIFSAWGDNYQKPNSKLFHICPDVHQMVGKGFDSKAQPSTRWMVWIRYLPTLILTVTQ